MVFALEERKHPSKYTHHCNRSVRNYQAKEGSWTPEVELPRILQLFKIVSPENREFLITISVLVTLLNQGLDRLLGHNDPCPGKEAVKDKWFRSEHIVEPWWNLQVLLDSCT